ncbi:hypothetical protein ACFVT5_02400 [Streptomyces sp. NPDC058001]|uniref:hypothetical protein n=1 Tax=Streptomyces sp. NPDC058001 TaxID=3346300 RepID=UPI0036EA3726
MTGVLTWRRPRPLIAVGSLLAALVVVLLPLPPAAQPAVAADGDSSAVTKSGAKGKYDDFSDLKVTVHQTQGLRSQGVRVTWKGGAQTAPGNGNFNINYLQIMQCWGDDPAGPDREQCVYGGSGAVVGDGQGRVLNTSQDPAESSGKPFVAFRPANGEPATKEAYDYTYFGPLDTNEQQANMTFANGTGETEFELQDGVESDYLGCGANTAPEGSTPKPRRCWLAVVPRGDHEADGRHVTQPGSDRLRTSPLSATNWDQRIVFPLSFLQVDQYCPEGQPERPTVGSELVTDAVTSWQPKLCTSTGSTFGFTSASEELARSQVLGTSSEAPTLGYTVDPVAQPEGGPAVVHAPLAVSGLAFAFFIEGPDGVVRDIRLTPRLVAKMLTHSYQADVPKTAPPPEHVRANPVSYVVDPEFRRVNPDFPTIPSGLTMSLMVPIGNSDTTRLVWNWLQSDGEARDFLAGKPDPDGMRVNSYFKDLQIDKNAELNEFPKVDPTLAPAQASPAGSTLTYTILDLAPYTGDLHEGALRARRGNNNRTITYQAGADPSMPPKLTNDAPPPGARAVIAIVDVASAERYGLPTAALRNADGTFVRPSADTLLADVATMQPSSADPGVLKPDPARAKGQAYPLTAVTYAAASVNQDAAARKAYAEFIRYAAGPGQTPGLSAGELPPGYAPLPAKLRTLAETAADDLERGTPSTDPPGGEPDPNNPGGAGSGLSGGAGGDTSGAGGSSAAGGAGGGATDAASEPAATSGSPSPSAGPQQNAADAKNGLTPREIMGVIRWVLLGVLILGATAALSGPVMLRLAHRRTP